MAIGFSNIPADIRVPLFYAEMDNSAANSATSAMRRLIVAQVNDNIAPSEVGKLVLVSSVALAKKHRWPGLDASLDVRNLPQG
jgi:phage tail sheath gpL-like